MVGTSVMTVGGYGLVKAVSTLVDAYAESKRINLEFAKLRAESELRNRVFDLQEQQLKQQHAEQLRKIDVIEQKLEREMASLDQQLEANLDERRLAQQAACQLITVIVDPETEPERMERLIYFYNQIQVQLDQKAAMATTTLIQVIEASDRKLDRFLAGPSCTAQLPVAVSYADFAQH